jgi:hypothetical protein
MGIRTPYFVGDRTAGYLLNLSLLPFGFFFRGLDVATPLLLVGRALGIQLGLLDGRGGGVS